MKRQSDPKDRRGVIIELTPLGRRLVGKAVSENTRQEAALVAGLSQRDRRQLGDLLRRLLAGAEPPTDG